MFLGSSKLSPSIVSSLLFPSFCPKYYPGQKKRTIPEIRGQKNTVRSCDIMLDDARSTQCKVIRDCPRLLPCADRASSGMISHDGTAFFSPRISRMVLFFVQGSRMMKKSVKATNVLYSHANGRVKQSAKIKGFFSSCSLSSHFLQFSFCPLLPQRNVFCAGCLQRFDPDHDQRGVAASRGQCKTAPFSHFVFHRWHHVT